MSYAFKALQLKARHQALSLLAGQSLSKRQGEGYDFAQLREYQRGDEVRKIQWTITAKLGKPYIKELHANKELHIVVATLSDAGLYFATDKSKEGMLCHIASILAYASIGQNDLFTGLAYKEAYSYASMPSKEPFIVEEFAKALFDSELLGTKLDKQNAVKDMFLRITKPSLVFVLGDFLDEVDLGVLAQKHEVLAIVIRHREEENPKNLGEISLNNPYDGTLLNTYFGKKTRKQFDAKRQAHDAKMFEHFSAQGIRYVKICSDEDPLAKLMALFI